MSNRRVIWTIMAALLAVAGVGSQQIPRMGSNRLGIVPMRGATSKTSSGVIAADQAGNATFNAAPEVTQNITISKADQTITFGTPPTLMVGDAATVSATASSGLAVTFSSLAPGRLRSCTRLTFP